MNPDTLRYWLWVGFRRLPILAITTLVCVLAGIALIMVLPPVYRAVATIALKSPQIAPDLARPTVPSDTLTQVAAIQGEVFVRDNLLVLAERFGIYGDHRPKADADIIEDLRERIRFEFVNVGAIQNADSATTISVAFDHGNPAKAAAVVNHLVSVILDKNFLRRAERAGDTLAFFEQEATALGAALSQAEADILRFKNENIDALPDSLDFRYTQRSSAQERLVQLEREEAGLRGRRETLLTTGAADPTFSSVGDQELFELRRLLEQRLTVFTPTSPSVLDVRERIAAFERQRSAEGIAAADDRELPGELRIQLAEIEGRLDFIEQEKAGIADTLDELQASITVTPEVETELNRLTRNYESTAARYLAAVQGQAEATIGAQIEARLKGERLTLLEAPVVPEKPIRPQRRKILLASLLAGIGLGCVIIALLELLDGRVRRAAQLVHRLGLEPIATIPHIDAPRGTPARRIRALGVGTAVVGMAAGALVVVHVGIVPLDAAALRILHAVGLPFAGRELAS
ncbi:hypothetical protein [uncultured Paracoccus sp.]|uniref:GumC family protein n=1 Tax=uncultured Paracoccus sp. TaxID=189685 RepID=UPI00260FCDC7|nr:hypothetical protein [uncultured Paracoccus sp.]